MQKFQINISCIRDKIEAERIVNLKDNCLIWVEMAVGKKLVGIQNVKLCHI